MNELLIAAGFTPAQAVVVGLIIAALTQQTVLIRRLKLRSAALSRDRNAQHTYAVESRVRLELLEKRAANDNAAKQPK